MAVQPDLVLTNFTVADANYPYGSAKNETVPAALDGSEYKKIRADDVFGFQQALLKAAGIVPSGTADTAIASQYLQGVLHQALTGGFMVDSGVADVYALAPVGVNQAPPAYKDGQMFAFTPLVTNTGASTANVATLGAKNIKIFGADPVAGDLTAGRQVIIFYNLGLDRFDLIVLNVRAATKTLQEAAASNDVAVTPGTQQHHPSAAKAVVYFSGAGAILYSYGVASVVRSGAGVYVVTWSIPFLSTNYAAPVSSARADTNVRAAEQARAAGSITVRRVIDSTGAAEDGACSVVAYGPQ